MVRGVRDSPPFDRGPRSKLGREVCGVPLRAGAPEVPRSRRTEPTVLPEFGVPTVPQEAPRRVRTHRACGVLQTAPSPLEGDYRDGGQGAAFDSAGTPQPRRAGSRGRQAATKQPLLLFYGRSSAGARPTSGGKLRLGLHNGPTFGAVVQDGEGQGSRRRNDSNFVCLGVSEGPSYFCYLGPATKKVAGASSIPLGGVNDRLRTCAAGAKASTELCSVHFFRTAGKVPPRRVPRLRRDL